MSLSQAYVLETLVDNYHYVYFYPEKSIEHPTPVNAAISWIAYTDTDLVFEMECGYGNGWCIHDDTFGYGFVPVRCDFNTWTCQCLMDGCWGVASLNGKLFGCEAEQWSSPFALTDQLASYLSVPSSLSYGLSYSPYKASIPGGLPFYIWEFFCSQREYAFEYEGSSGFSVEDPYFGYWFVPARCDFETWTCRYLTDESEGCILYRPGNTINGKELYCDDEIWSEPLQLNQNDIDIINSH